MRKFRKQQKAFKGFMNFICIFTALFMLGFIFCEPLLKEMANGGKIINGLNYTSQALVLISLGFVFGYNIKFSKTNSLLEWIEYELDDAGFYYLNRNETNSNEFIENSQKMLIEDKFITENNVDAHDFDIALRGMKGKSMIYFADVEDLDRNDIIAYIDSVTYDVTVKNLKRKADIVIVFVTNSATEDAKALAKMVTTMGRKDQIKLALAIAEIDSKNCYFLGNRPTNIQKLIAKYVMNAELPFDEKLISTQRLKSQDELEETMKTFNAKDFVDGKFFIR